MERKAAVAACVAASMLAALTAGAGRAGAAAGDPDDYYFDCVRQLQLDPAFEPGVQAYLFGSGGLFATYGDSVTIYTNAPAGETWAQLLVDLDPTHVVRATPAAGYYVLGTLRRNACPPATAQPEDGIFLCYSAYEIEPGVWPESEAAKLEKAGYWRPYAVAGTASGTRLGSYSLVCGLAKSEAKTGTEIDGAGNPAGAATGSRYEVAG